MVHWKYALNNTGRPVRDVMSPLRGMKHPRCLPSFKVLQRSRVCAEVELTMSRGLKTWWTSSSDDGLEMADFKRAFSE